MKDPVLLDTDMSTLPISHLVELVDGQKVE